MLTELVDVFYFQLSVSNHLKLLVSLLDPLFLSANRLSDGGSHLFACSFLFYCFHIDLILCVNIGFVAAKIRTILISSKFRKKKGRDDVKSLNLHLYHNLLYWGGGGDA